MKFQTSVSFRALLTCALVALIALPVAAAPPAEQVAQAKAAGADFVSANIFAGAADLDADVTKSSFAYREVSSVLRDATLLTLDVEAVKALRHAGPEHLALEVPFGVTKNRQLRLELVKVDPFTADFKVLTSTPEANTDYDLGVHYRGVVAGEADSLVAVSIFKDELMGFAVSEGHGNVTIGRMQGKHVAADSYIAYADSQLFGVDRTMGCDMDSRVATGAAEKLASTSANRLPLERPAALGTKAVGDCVGIYLEADYNIYQNKGSTQATTNWVTGIYNQLATLYSTDNIETGLNQVFVWNSSSPYTSGSNTSLLLSQFQNNRTSFNGDLGHLMKLGGISGVADGFNGICASNQAASQSVAYVQSTYSTVPTYSGTVFVVAHEIGHTAGSRHTHACVWNGNNTAIDGCSGFTEGSCSLPGNPPGGGTIMSYCPNASVGVDFTQAFHPQPASVILNKIASASCLSASCSGGGGGGTCNGTTYSGSLSGSGDWDAQPNGTYYYEGTSGTHRGVLDGPGNADFDLELRRWNGSWAVVDSGTSPNSSEDVSYNGSAGYYYWRVLSYSGSGSYTLCIERP